MTPAAPLTAGKSALGAVVGLGVGAVLAGALLASTPPARGMTPLGSMGRHVAEGAPFVSKAPTAGESPLGAVIRLARLLAGAGTGRGGGAA